MYGTSRSVRGQPRVFSSDEGNAGVTVSVAQLGPVHLGSGRHEQAGTVRYGTVRYGTVRYPWCARCVLEVGLGSTRNAHKFRVLRTRCKR
jgi:hypothetical protein